LSPACLKLAACYADGTRNVSTHKSCKDFALRSFGLKGAALRMTRSTGPYLNNCWLAGLAAALLATTSMVVSTSFVTGGRQISSLQAW
jgi:hypothetical protein